MYLINNLHHELSSQSFKVSQWCGGCVEAGMYFAVSSVVRFAAAGMHLVLSVPGFCHLTSPKPVRVQNGKPVGPKISFKLEI